MKKLTKAKLNARTDAALEWAAETQVAYLAGELELTYTPSGLGYVIHAEGQGALAKDGEKVEVHYVGMLSQNGKVFDETFSRARGTRFQLGRGEVVAGWDEAVALLPRGSEATLIVPAKLGYGPKGRGQGIPSNSELLFYVQVEE